jgi:glycyl-tRNA synthetase
MSLKLRSLGVSSRVDDSSASIGKRYSRNDELGTPLGITIDFQSVQDKTYTLRDRDSTKQVRADEETILKAIKSLVEGEKVWADVEKSMCQFAKDFFERTNFCRTFRAHVAFMKI